MKKNSNKKNLFKSKKQKIYSIVAFVIMLGLFIYLGTRSFGSDETDAVRFSNEFPSVSEDNVFVYATASEVLDAIDGYTIVLFGSSANEFTEEYANLINEVASSTVSDSGVSITTVLYYDFISDRTNNNGNYELIVKTLEPYLLTDDLKNTEIYAPTILIVSDGFVEYIDTDVNFVNGSISSSEYWTDYNKDAFKETLAAAFLNFIGEE